MERNDYIVENAAYVAHKHVTKKVSRKFSIEDIIEVLNAKNEWGEQNKPLPDSKKPKELKKLEDSPDGLIDLMDFIIQQCHQRGIYINHFEVFDILCAEGLYYEAIMGTSYVDDIIYYNDSRY